MTDSSFAGVRPTVQAYADKPLLQGSVDSKYYPTKPAGTMLNIAIIFLIFAVVAGIFGFGGVASTPTSGAKIFFVLFLFFAFLATLM